MAGLILVGLGCCLYLNLWLLAVLPVIAVFIWRESVRLRRRQRALAKARAGEDIGSFAREFDCHATDTWVLRAVYEELSRCNRVDGRAVPLRADDRLREDLEIDDEDLALDLVPAIAHRAERSLENTEVNPLYDKVKTVRDLVQFMEHQARTSVNQ